MIQMNDSVRKSWSQCGTRKRVRVTKWERSCHGVHRFASLFSSTMSDDMAMSALPIELMALTCQWISTSDLRSMRLVSRNVSAITTPATFETVHFSPSTVACLLDEFPHLVPHARYTRLLCDGSERSIGE
jgi:hypothetical protein